MFDAAATKSPHHSVDIVIANAGVGRGDGDPMMRLEGKYYEGVRLRGSTLTMAYLLT